MSTASCVIDSTGIHAPTFVDILTALQNAYLAAFGSTAYIDPDSQDGQLLAILASAFNDNNAAAVAVYNSYSPSFAIGNGLSNQVKINGIRRLVASNSTANVTLVGQAGTIINNGVVSGNSGSWDLPASVTIPFGGSITVLATCQTLGAVPAVAGSLNQIATPTRGWQTVTNPADATLGNPVETDYGLRIRQKISVAFPALAVIEAVKASVLNVAGVIKGEVYENVTGATDSNGLPEHSISVVTSGGDPVAIATAIANRKTPGTNTYGTTTETILVGNHPNVINFFVASNQVLTATISLHPLTAYTTLDGNNAAQRLVDFITGLAIGQAVYLTSAQAAAIGSTYHLISIAFGLNGGGQSIADVACPFNGLMSLALAEVTITLV